MRDINNMIRGECLSPKKVHFSTIHTAQLGLPDNQVVQSKSWLSAKIGI